MGLDSLRRIDYRWGFSNKSIKTITRLSAPGPRSGLFALLDQPSFRVSDLPPLPAGLSGFTTFSVDLAASIRKILPEGPAAAPTPASRVLEDVTLNIREKTGLDLERDLLAPLGPVFTLYGSPKTGPLPETPLGGLLRGMLQPPRYALVTSIKNPDTYARNLERLIPELNKDIAALAVARRNAHFPSEVMIPPQTLEVPFGRSFDVVPEAAPVTKDAPVTIPAPAGIPKASEPIPKAQLEAPKPLDAVLLATVASRISLQDDPTLPRLVKLAGPRRGWTLSQPIESIFLGLGLRPTLEVGQNTLALATSPEVAAGTLALEGRPPGPPADDPLRASLGDLPESMTFLSISDPRQGIMPELLANLPSLVNVFLRPDSLVAQFPPLRDSLPGRISQRFGGSHLPPVSFADPPEADEIRKFLFPSRAVFSASEEGFTLETLEAFPILNPSAIAPLAGAALFAGFSTAQSAATRAQSTNNLKMIGLAIHNFHDANGRMPADIKDAQGNPILSWRVELLPFLEENQTFNAIKQDEPWDSPVNKAVLEQTPRVFEIPGSPGPEPGTTFYRGFASPVSAFDPSSRAGIRLQDFVDGTSNTIAVVEAREAVPWTKPDSDIPFDHDAPPDRARDLISELGGHFAGGFNALFMDGSVRFIRESVHKMVLRVLITRNGGEVISADSF
jgi:prepilin-type processing-associated H-X9-DG protein